MEATGLFACKWPARAEDASGVWRSPGAGRIANAQPPRIADRAPDPAPEPAPDRAPDRARFNSR
jgi:hypothetical protein